MAQAATQRRSEVLVPLPRRQWRPRLARPSLEQLPPRLLVALAILFNLWTLRGATSIVQNLNDSHLHFAMVRWARTQIMEGKIVPVDNWFPYLGLGSAQFRHYSDLGHILAGYISVIAGATTTYYWSLYLLLSLWPLSVYLGARLLGWDRWTATIAALLAPLLASAMSYGFERSSYAWYGLGLWSQLWGMWLLPIALGLTWRALRGNGSYALAALAVSLTIAGHYLEGYVALMAIGLWALVTPSQLVPRVARAVALGAGSLLASAWVLAPLFQDTGFGLNSEYGRDLYFTVGFGAPQVLRWLVTGQLYDAGRQLPVVSLLVGLGLIVCLVRFRRDERARAVVVLWLASLLRFCGRPLLGSLLDFLPGGGFLALHRFIMGVHLAGLFLGGIGVVWLGQRLIALARWARPRIQPALVAAAAVLMLVLALSPAWRAVAAQDDIGRLTQSTQKIWDTTDGADLQVLIDWVKTLSPGRVYAGSRWGWGQNYAIGWVPVYTVLSNQDVDTVGFKLRVASLMSDAEMVFDETNPADYDLFGIHYLILPADRPPAIKATLLGQSGRHTLWQVDTSGYLEVVDTTWPPIVENSGSIATHALNFLSSPQLAQHQYPTVAFNGADAALPSLPSGVVPQGPAGRVEHEVVSLNDGTFKADVIANRTATIMLKVSYDPRWRVTVDGIDLRPDMIAPALMGRTVTAGRHSVTFHYVPDPGYPWLFAIGLLALLALGMGPRLLSRAVSDRAKMPAGFVRVGHSVSRRKGGG